MFAWDVDGDGDADVVSSEDAHGYGLAWWEQIERAGDRSFVRHRIAGERPHDTPYGVVVGNLHALAAVDVDGDGLRDIVIGNRYWAHSGRDPADRETPALYWFRCVRSSGPEGTEFIPHLIHGDSGVGTQVCVADVDGDTTLDVVVGNKKGVFVHRHRIEKVGRERWLAEGWPKRRERSASFAGIEARTRGGRVINLDFETGDLSDWTATGTAFERMPVHGDTVVKRRGDMTSEHEGAWWIGTYERAGDGPRGTLMSVSFPVRHRWASFLVGGGRHPETRVEIVRADTGIVVFGASGRDHEAMHAELVDLAEHEGQDVFLRLVDDHSGGWGHLNFDHFRFHAAQPPHLLRPERIDSRNQRSGYSPDVAATRMKVPEGFRVSLVAAEPALTQPIALAIDDAGRLWVAEAHAYPRRRTEGQGKDRILVFEDTTGDGRFDRRSVFAEKLNLVSGLEVGFGGVWVGAAPYLLFIPDADRDLVADGEPEVVLDGFGYQDTHETLNAFIWGPDGWLYGCHGVFTHSRVGRPGTPDAERVPINAGV